MSHELYNVGHMYEAAVAHYLATGKNNFLNVALKSVDFIDSVFGVGKKRDIPGHQEIEMGLVKLYRVTGEERYLNLAKFFLDERGHYHGREAYNLFDIVGYSQDHLPVTEQTEVVGHAVRAVYMYAGMADVATLTGDQAYIKALDALWHDLVDRKMYITGGIGSSHHGESFGKAYDLPNAAAYNETCAAIADIFWNQRMFLLHGDAKYHDVLSAPSTTVFYQVYRSRVIRPFMLTPWHLMGSGSLMSMSLQRGVLGLTAPVVHPISLGSYHPYQATSWLTRMTPCMSISLLLAMQLST